MTTALVTGGAGFIGGHLVARLIEDGFDVIVLDDLSWGKRSNLPDSPKVKLLTGDVRELDAQRASFAAVTHVFHLAALISAHDSLNTPDPYFSVNVGGLLRVLEACKGLATPRLIFASTSGVYGNTPDPIKSEAQLPQPATVYALTKLAGEQLLDMYRERLGFDDVSLRFFNVYGPGQSFKHPYANVTCRFSRAAACGLPIELYGDGEQTRDFIYVDDVVRAVMTVATRPTRHRVYNVGTGEDASIASMLEIVQRAAGTAVEVRRLPPWPNDIRAIKADMRRLREELGFEASVPLHDGLSRTVDYFRRVGPDA